MMLLYGAQETTLFNINTIVDTSLKAQGTQGSRSQATTVLDYVYDKAQTDEDVMTVVVRMPGLNMNKTKCN